MSPHRVWRRLAGAGLLLAAALTAQGALAHAVIKHAVPAAGATLMQSPKEIAITFNEKVEAAFSSVTLKDAAGKDVASAKGNVDAANPAILRLALPALTPGAYQVKWVAVGNDGHRRTGDYKFTVK